MWYSNTGLLHGNNIFLGQKEACHKDCILHSWIYIKFKRSRYFILFAVRIVVTFGAKEEKASGFLESCKWCSLIWVVVIQTCSFCDNQAIHLWFVHYPIFMFSIFMFQFKMITKNKINTRISVSFPCISNSQFDTAWGRGGRYILQENLSIKLIRIT